MDINEMTTENKIRQAYSAVINFVDRKYRTSDQTGKAMKAGAEMILHELGISINDENEACDICGLPRKDHPWKSGKMGAAGYCLFAPSGREVI